jgi:hypothetical protein
MMSCETSPLYGRQSVILSIPGSPRHGMAGREAPVSRSGPQLADNERSCLQLWLTARMEMALGRTPTSMETYHASKNTLRPLSLRSAEPS